MPTPIQDSTARGMVGSETSPLLTHSRARTLSAILEEIKEASALLGAAPLPRDRVRARPLDSEELDIKLDSGIWRDAGLVALLAKRKLHNDEEKGRERWGGGGTRRNFQSATGETTTMMLTTKRQGDGMRWTREKSKVGMAVAVMALQRIQRSVVQMLGMDLGARWKHRSLLEGQRRAEYRRLSCLQSPGREQALQTRPRTWRRTGTQEALRRVLGSPYRSGE